MARKCFSILWGKMLQSAWERHRLIHETPRPACTEPVAPDRSLYFLLSTFVSIAHNAYFLGRTNKNAEECPTSASPGPGSSRHWTDDWVGEAKVLLAKDGHRNKRLVQQCERWTLAKCMQVLPYCVCGIKDIDWIIKYCFNSVAHK